MKIERIYSNTAFIFAIITFLLIATVNPTLPSIHRCLARQADGAFVSTPNVVTYSAYKGLLWPVSLIWSVGSGQVSFSDWLFARYEPFPDACR